MPQKQPPKGKETTTMEQKPLIQNAETPLQQIIPEASKVCEDIAVRVFDRIMQWSPVKEASTRAAAILITEMDNADFFTEKYSLTERQQELFRNRIAEVMQTAAQIVVTEISDYAKKREEYVGRVVIEEMMKISEETMKAIGQSINRGALLAMTAVAANAKNEDYDEITMRKSKIGGDITIPTRGVFISTNCIERIKQDINFLKKDIDAEVK